MPTGKTVDQLPSLPEVQITDTDKLLLWDDETGTSRKIAISELQQHQADLATVHGYYGRLTNYYFTGGVATATEIPIESVDTFITPDFTMDAQGLFDNRMETMKAAVADPFDAATSTFSLEGLTTTSFVNFRASFTFEPDEDGGEVDVRLLMGRHSGATPSTDFEIADVALTMTQGADIEYASEAGLTFFVGDTIDTNAAGDAGTSTFQLRSTVPGTVRMRALTWYLFQ